MTQPESWPPPPPPPPGGPQPDPTAAPGGYHGGEVFGESGRADLPGAAPAAHPPGGAEPGHDAVELPGHQVAAGPYPGSPGYPHATGPAPYGQPGYPAPYGSAAGYGFPGYGAPPRRETNALAIGAMVVSGFGVLGLCGYGVFGVIGAIGAILGHVARRQIAERNQDGAELAKVAIITGWITTGIGVLAGALIVVLVVFMAQLDGGGGVDSDGFDALAALAGR